MQVKAKFNKRSAWATFALVVLSVGGYLIYHYGYMVYQDYDYYTHYESVSGLQRSNPVFINGVRVGEVSEIVLSGAEKKVTVTMSIDKDIPIPKGSKAKLVSSGVLGRKMIFLETGQSPELYTHKDVLVGVYDTSIMDMSEQIEPIVESVKYILGTADKNFSNFNRRLDNGLVKKTQKDARDMEQSMNKYQNQVAQIRNSANEIITTLHEFRKKSDTIKSGNKQLTATIKNVETSTASLAKEPIAEPVNKLRSAVNSAKEQASKIEESELVNTILTDDKTYKKTADMLQNVNNDAKELKENPKGFQLIGGGK